MATEYDVKDVVVLITGAASGLGAATAEAFLRDGAKHVAILDVAVEQGKVTEDNFNSTFGAGSCKFYQCDVTDEDVLYSIFDKIVVDQGKLDVVVNNAGVMVDRKDMYKKMIQINYTALVSSTFKAIEMWRADQGGAGGTVINISSEVAVRLAHPLPVYNGTKGAVLHFSISIGMEPHFSRTKVRVLSMCPGITHTALFDNKTTLAFDEPTNTEIGHMDIGRLGQKPELVAAGIVEMYKRGKSASTWLVSGGEPLRDITDIAMQRFGLGAFD